MEQTGNYQLNLWDGEDRILREDFNADNVKTEEALADVAAQAALISKCGNCKIECKTYVGNGRFGSSNANSLTFSAPPLIVFIAGYDGFHLCMVSGYNQAQNNEYYPVTITWRGNTVSWYSAQGADYQSNMSNYTYHAVALMAADA